MPKFSIIIPVYNVEKYIEKCLQSVLNQSEKDYEVIVVNDGTKDNSIQKIKDYPVKIINQENKGLSAARNKGQKEATGEYLIFLDSDDYFEKDLLKELKKSLKNNPDIVRFQIQEVFGNNKIIKYEEEPFENQTGEEAFKKITKYHFVENAWCYAIKRSYYEKNNFKFKEKTLHEDFGLVPLIVIKATTVNSISYIGYNYFQRQNSIMNSNDQEKTKKKVNDFYEHYNYLLKEIEKTTLEKDYFKSFIANSLILKITELGKKDYKKYKKILLKEKIFDNILTNTTTRKIKKLFLKISPKLFYRLKNNK